MGIVAVASLAARVSVAPDVTMTSTLRRKSSAARAGARLKFPSGFGYSMAMFFPLDVTQIAQALSEGDELAEGSATEKSYPLDFRRLLRAHFNPAHRECEDESNNPHQFSDFGLPILDCRIENSTIESGIVSSCIFPVIQNLKLKDPNCYLMTRSARTSTLGGIVSAKS